MVALLCVVSFWPLLADADFDAAFDAQEDEWLRDPCDRHDTHQTEAARFSRGIMTARAPQLRSTLPGSRSRHGGLCSVPKAAATSRLRVIRVDDSVSGESDDETVPPPRLNRSSSRVGFPQLEAERGHGARGGGAAVEPEEIDDTDDNEDLGGDEADEDAQAAAKASRSSKTQASRGSCRPQAATKLHKDDTDSDDDEFWSAVQSFGTLNHAKPTGAHGKERPATATKTRKPPPSSMLRDNEASQVDVASVGLGWRQIEAKPTDWAECQLPKKLQVDAMVIPAARHNGDSTAGVVPDRNEQAEWPSDAATSPPVETALKLVPVCVLHVNCGRDGLLGNNEIVLGTILAVGLACGQLADVAVLTETHLAAGDTAKLEGYDVYWQPRPDMPAYHNRGGVCVAVRAGLQLAEEPAIISRSTVGDVMWLRLRLERQTTPLFIAAVYLPPKAPKRTCSCYEPACNKAHIEQLLDELANSVQTLSRAGDVLLLGDFNARLGSGDPREMMIQHQLLTACSSLVVLNPVHDDGRYLTTRQDPHTFRESVLDMVLCSMPLHSHVLHRSQPPATHVHRDSCVSAVLDHFAMSVMFPVSVHATLASCDKAGFQSACSTDNDAGGCMEATAGQVPKRLCTRRASLSEVLTSLTNLRIHCNVAEIVSGGVRSVHQQLTASPDFMALASAVETIVESLLRAGHTKALLGIVEGNSITASLRHILLIAAQKHGAVHRSLTVIVKRLKQLQLSGKSDPELADPSHFQQLVQQRKALRNIIRKKHQDLRHHQLELQHKVLMGIWSGDGIVLEASRRQFQALLKRAAMGKHDQPRVQRVARPIRQVLNAKVAMFTKHLAVAYSRRCYASDPCLAGVSAKACAQRAVARRQLQHRVRCGSCQHPGDQHVSQSEVVTAIANLKSSSAVIGSVAPPVLKAMLSTTLLAMIHQSLNAIFITGEVPQALCTVKATMVHKSGDVNDPRNYRVIGVGDVWARLLQNVLLGKLMAHCHQRNVITWWQFGFQAGRSCETAAATAKLLSETDRALGRTVYQLFVDIKGAFGSVNHDILLGILHEYQFPACL